MKKSIQSLDKQYRNDLQQIKELIQKQDTPITLHAQAIESLTNQCKQFDQLTIETKLRLSSLSEKISQELVVQLNSVSEEGKETNRKLTTMTESVEKSRKVLESAQQDITSLQKTSVEQETFVNRNKNELGKIQQFAEQLETSIKQTNQTLSTTNENQMSQLEGIQKQVGTLEVYSRQSVGAIETLQKQQQTLQISVDTLENQNRNTTETLEHIQTNLSQISSIDNQGQQNAKQVSELASSVKKVQHEQESSVELTKQKLEEIQKEIDEKLKNISMGASEEQIQKLETDLQNQIKEFSETSLNSVIQNF